jgi:hypothetical protein
LEKPFERPFHAKGDSYSVILLGRSRPDGLWEARIQFEPEGGGGVVLTTPVVSTQPSEETLIRWGRGLGDAFFEFAFERALASIDPRKRRRSVKQSPANNACVDPIGIQRRVLECFSASGQRAMNREAFFEQIGDFSNADVQRAIESLERAGRVARFTDRGSAWVTLREARAQKPVRSGDRDHRKAVLIYEHPHPIQINDRDIYDAIVFGVRRFDGTWSGWIQFREPKTNRKFRTGQETSQPDRGALEYWATGLEHVYFEGALHRAEAIKEN